MSAQRSTPITHAAVGCGDVIDGVDSVIYIGDVDDVTCPKCKEILAAETERRRIEANKERFVVKHLDASRRIITPDYTPATYVAYPDVLHDLLAEQTPEGPYRLVSLVPAGSHIPSGTYLATWERVS